MPDHRPAGELVAGIDLGSTAMKMIVVDADGREVAGAQRPTPWRVGSGGTTELDASAVIDTVQTLVADICRPLRQRTDARIVALAIAGMGETGIVIDADGEAVAPGFAWFDPRGAAQAAAFPAEVRREFAGRTGLPLGAQVTVSKLAYLRDAGVRLRGRRWLNLPEFVASSLGAEVALERSLTSRTGLLDQDTGAVWPAMCDALGIDGPFLPEVRDAGASWGHVDAARNAWLAGAAVTVAGHDHLVAAEADGALLSDGYHVSLGTAEVLLRVLDAPLGFAARERLAGALINEVAHIVPGQHVLVAGVKTGLLLRRALQSAGVSDRAGRDRVDDAVMALPYEGALPAGTVEVSGARNDDGVLRLAFHADGVSPAETFAAVLRHSNDEIALLIEAMDQELPPATHATLTGGWAGMSAVRRARERVLPALTVSEREQETAYGAARIARAMLHGRLRPAAV